MIGLLILAILLVMALSASVYLIGYLLGSHGWRAKLDQVRAESRVAERQLHDLTRKAFIAMSDRAFRCPDHRD